MSLAKFFGNRTLGVIFVGLMILGLWFINAVFSQKFTSFDKVDLVTSTAGLQLPTRADVKIRGVIVGEVRDAKPVGDHAVLTLGIDPDKIAQIPENVTASLLPKTLFGEKYVELDIPSAPATQSLKAGDTIEKTQLPIEVEKVLNDLYPLLRTVQPAELSYTLNAVAGALEGRGEQIGESIGTLNSYLTRINPQIPALIQDLKLLDKVSGTYADVMPAIAQTLRNTVTTGKTLVSKEKQLNTFLKDVSSFSGTTRTFLDQNGDNLVKLGKLSEPQVALLKRYSPEFPCLLGGLVRQAPALGSTFRGFVFHINLELLSRQPRGYGPQDRHVNGADNAPNCAGLPYPKGANQAVPYGSARSPYKIPNFNDGVNGLNRGDNQRTATGFGRTGLTVTTGGTAEGQALVNSLVAPALGVSADRVPGLTTLLFGPLVAGTEVSSR